MLSLSPLGSENTRQSRANYSLAFIDEWIFLSRVISRSHVNRARDGGSFPFSRREKRTDGRPKVGNLHIRAGLRRQTFFFWNCVKCVSGDDNDISNAY